MTPLSPPNNFILINKNIITATFSEIVLGVTHLTITIVSPFIIRSGFRRNETDRYFNIYNINIC